MGKLLDKLTGKNPRDAKIAKQLKEMERRSDRNLAIADCGKLLGQCENSFNQTIQIERLNALQRRERRIGDAAQKQRIHDAAVGLLAAEEAQLALQSVTTAEDFSKALKKLGSVLRQLEKMDPSTTITKKDVRAETGMTFDDTNETAEFSERAEMVDEQFVENLIQGYSFEDCLRKAYPASNTVNLDGDFDFHSDDPGKDKAQINEILKRNAQQR